MTMILALLTAAAPISDVQITADDRRVIVVSSADLDLSTPSDVRRFDVRVHTAIERVCTVSGHTMEEIAWRDSCRAEAMASAIPGIAVTKAAAQRTRPIQLGAR